MRRQWRWWLVASGVVHVSAFGVAVWTIPPHEEHAVQVPPTRIEFELPAQASTRPMEHAQAQSAAPTPDLRVTPFGGSRPAQNVSAEQRGELGDGRSAERGTLLAARADGVNLDPHLLDNLRDAQEQRIHSSRMRASPQDDRRTPHPDADPWLATAAGVLLFRSPPDRLRPAQGALVSPGTAVAEGATPQLDGLGVARRADPGARPRVAAGVMSVAQGRAHQAAGPSAFLRPSVEVGHPSTTADLAARRPDDDQDSAMLAASLSRSYVSATVQEGPQRAEGVGGLGGGGAPGTGGGLGRGGSAHPMADGDGWLSLSSGDDRYIRYFQEVRRRLDPLWAEAFPREESLQLHQGTVALAFVIEPDGAITGVHVVRRSGVADFDTNVRNAIMGARVPPVPASLGHVALRIHHSFQFRNPVVR